MSTTQQQIPTSVPALNTLALDKSDWDKLREEYGAVKGGEWRYEKVIADSAKPSFKLAAQLDLDRFHNGEPYVLDWGRLFGVQSTPAPVASAPSLVELAAQIGKPAKTYNCTMCSDTGIAEEKDIGWEPECGTIYKTYYCQHCETGLAMDQQAAPAIHEIHMFGGKIVASAPITTTPPKLSDADYVIIRGALSCYFGEADGEQESWDLAARVEAYLKGKGL
jgi:hypothetical protein